MIYKETPHGILVNCKITPKSSCNQFAGIENDAIKVRIAAQPEKGAANEELVAYLAKVLGIGKSNIQIVQGLASRHKRVLIQNVPLAKLKLKFEQLLAK